MPIKMIELAKVVQSDRTVTHTQYCSVVDRLPQSDCTLTITIPELTIDPQAYRHFHFSNFHIAKHSWLILQNNLINAFKLINTTK